MLNLYIVCIIAYYTVCIWNHSLLGIHSWKKSPGQKLEHKIDVCGFVTPKPEVRQVWWREPGISSKDLVPSGNHENYGGCDLGQVVSVLRACFLIYYMGTLTSAPQFLSCHVVQWCANIILMGYIKLK